MDLISNAENNPPAHIALLSLYNRFQSASPSPIPIRKSRPLQSVNPNQPSRRAFADENKENYRLDGTCLRPIETGKSARSFVRQDMDESERDPFSRLSARTLALIDQPESEATIYDCQYCDKTYQGKHARSIWRRHLSDKHRIPLSTQPRRTRWDNDVNRPKTEEERRERTLESKRRWARKNRAAKKAARDGQRDSIEPASAMLCSKSLSQNSQRGTPDRSQAPSPILYPSSLGHTAAGSPEYFVRPEGHAQPNQPLQPYQISVPILSRASSAPQTFRHRLPDTSLSMVDVPYNPSFPVSQSTQSGSYSFGNYSVPTDAHSTSEFSDRFSNGENHPSYPHQPSQTQGALAPDGTSAKLQELAHLPDLPDCYPSAPLNFQYSSWELGGLFKFDTPLPTLDQTEPLRHELHSRHQRLSLSSSAPVHLQQFDDFQEAYDAYNVQGSNESRDCHPLSAQDPSVSSGEVVPVESTEETASESGGISGQRIYLGSNSCHMFGSTVDPNKRDGGFIHGHTPRPATAATFSDHQHPRVAHCERAATEPQFSIRHDLQTPLRETGLRCDGRARSPIWRMDEPGLDRLLASPGASQADPRTMSLYQSRYAPMSAGKRRFSESHQVHPSSSSCPLNADDWSNQALQTPTGFPRVLSGNGMLSSPAGRDGIFASPRNLLSKSLGLTIHNNAVSGEDCLGGLFADSSSGNMFYQRS